jgi:DtxR family Mn-dependent transcriptional regulator
MATQQTARMEDYLKRIALLGDGGNVVRVTEISKALGVKKPSVTSALKKLSQQGLVEHERYGQAALTPEGNRIAEDVARRYEVLRHFLAEILNVDPDIAAEDACKMEHSLSPASLERLAKLEEFLLNKAKGVRHS